MARARRIPRALLAAVLLVPSLVSGQAAPVSKQLEIAPPRQAPWPSLQFHYMTPTAVDLGPAGFAATWVTYFTTTDPRDADRVSDAISGMILSRAGKPVTELVVSTDVSSPEGSVEPPVMASTGWQRFVAVWSQPRDLGSDIWFRCFGAGGVPLDESARVLGDRPDGRNDVSPAVASAGDGRFAIAWMRNVVDPRDHTNRWTPMLQIFDASGSPLTAEIEVSPASPGENDARPAVAVRDDTLMVLWPVPGERRLLLGQRFDASGQPLAERFNLGEMGNGGVAATAGAAPGFVASWAGRGRSGETLTVVQKLFPTDGPVRFGVAGAGGFEPSLARDRHGNVALFWIDGKRPALALFNQDLVRQGPILYDPPATRRPGMQNTGGVTLADGGRIYTVWLGSWVRGAEPSILGRVWRARKDADLCVVRNGLFLCDTANDGGTAERKLRFGQAGETPFLADADGDGRAEACVFRDRRFLCDTAHDGAAAEWDTEAFERMPPDAQPLLADVDFEDDHYADPCYRSGTRWVCLIWNQMIGTHAIAWDFGLSTDVGLLAHVAGDAAADPCVFRRGIFICQSWQGSGWVKTRFDLRRELGQLGGGTPLLADMDGDGLADPCLYEGGKLLCGIFKPGSQRPARTVELSFGVDGDIPVLGDVDAF